MNVTDLAELLRGGEGSAVEFKRDDVRPERIAEAIAALLNHGGGHILLGVEDDGSVSGLTREPRAAGEWVMQVARDRVQPATAPAWETVEWEGGAVVGVISLPGDAPNKANGGNSRFTNAGILDCIRADAGHSCTYQELIDYHVSNDLGGYGY